MRLKKIDTQNKSESDEDKEEQPRTSTVFVKNISFETSDEVLKAKFEEVRSNKVIN